MQKIKNGMQHDCDMYSHKLWPKVYGFCAFVVQSLK